MHPSGLRTDGARDAADNARAARAGAARIHPAAVTPTGDIGEIDFGARLNSTGTVGRFQRFIDLRSGPTLDRLRFARTRDTWAFRAQVDHAGYRDQRYLATFDRFGKLQASFEWAQVPLLYGTVTRTPYREEVPGVLRLDDAVQAAVQNRTATLGDVASQVRQFDLRSRRDMADARIRFWPSAHLDLSAAFTRQARTGEQPWGAPFGFNNATGVPVPLDYRTDAVTTAAEWSTDRGMARLAYDGSWFNNDVEALIWDNPLRFTDQTYASGYVGEDAASQGRMG